MAVVRQQRRRAAGAHRVPPKDWKLKLLLLLLESLLYVYAIIL